MQSQAFFLFFCTLPPLIYVRHSLQVSTILFSSFFFKHAKLNLNSRYSNSNYTFFALFKCDIQVSYNHRWLFNRLTVTLGYEKKLFFPVNMQFSHQRPKTFYHREEMLRFMLFGVRTYNHSKNNKLQASNKKHTLNAM